MKFEELKGKTVEELNSMIREMKREQLNLRFQAATGELTNMGRFKEVRRSIARLCTAINQKKEG